jgi:hypothetical protein
MTVTKLTIQADDDALRADVEDSPHLASAAALEQTYFVVPTRFAVDGNELLAFPGVCDAWRPLPLLGFAPRLRELATGLKDGQEGTIFLADGGHLAFRRTGADVLISSSIPGKEATISAERLTEIAVAFAREVCEYVLSIIPAMAAHGSWNTWCDGSSS